MVTPWALETTSVLDELNVTADGLSSAEAAKRFAAYGPNKLPDPKRPSFFARLLGHLKNVIIIILIAAAIAKLLLTIFIPDANYWVDFGVIIGVVALTVAIGMVQEGRAEKSLAAIKNMLSPTSLVKRDGDWVEVDATTVVPGDVIRLKAGDRAPADARLLEATNLQVEEAALTGESVPAEKTLLPLNENAGIGDRTNMLFSSTIAVAGNGVAVVTGTGVNTEIGKIQDLMATATHEETPLSRTMDRFGKKVSLFVGGVAIIMGIFGIITAGVGAENVRNMFTGAVTVAVAAIPEGLSAVVVIALALGVKAIAQRNAISRNLNSTETLGSLSVICSDKTGTLTQNEMTVRVVRTASHEYQVEGAGYEPRGYLHIDGGLQCKAADLPAELISLADVSVNCNNAIINQNDKGLWSLTGEPTEGSMLVLGNKVGRYSDGWTRVAEIPFDSAIKYMATLVDDPSGERHIFVKGAMDQVMEHCTTQMGANGPEALDVDFWQAEMAAMAAQGLRVLAAARADVSSDVVELVDPKDGGPQGLMLVGIVGIVDPPRPEAIHSIAEAHAASIDVKMITGDHVITAKAIAQEMGITHGEARALTGPELEAMTDEELQAVVRETHVFARVSPEHKLRIVRALQYHGEIVAMTGDGVNDAPALTQANVGVAMGIKGTEATKAAADLILLDDNFSTIEKAIFEGRRVFDNIRKCTMFALPANVAQTMGILLATFIGWTVVDATGAVFTGIAAAPLIPVQILWVNLVVAVCLDLTFASEPGEPGIMRRKPRNQAEALVNARYARHIFLFGGVIGASMLLVFFLELNVFGGTMAQARTGALSMIMLAQTAHVFNVRRLNSSSFTWDIFRGNKTLAISLSILAVLHLALNYLPFMNTAFQLAPTSLRQWAIIVPLAFIVFCIIEFLKWAFKKGEDAYDAKMEAKKAALVAAGKGYDLAA